MFLPKRLKQAREKIGLSQEKAIVQFSNNGLQIGRNTLGSWEKGKTKPDIDELLIIAKVLNQSIFFFLALKPIQSGLGCDSIRIKSNRLNSPLKRHQEVAS